MPRRAKTTNNVGETRKIRPALTQEAQETQMISLAYDLVKQRLLDGTASSQETTHFLKLASTKHQLETEKLKAENELLRAKTKSIESNDKLMTVYEEALKAMRDYSGSGGYHD